MNDPVDPLTKTGGPVPDAAALVASSNELSNRVSTLAGLLADKAEKAEVKRTWKAIIGSYGLWVLDIALIIYMVTLALNVQGQNIKLETSTHESCSLYSLIVRSYNATAREKSPLGPLGYDAAFREMQDSADRLNCGIPHKI